MLAEILIILLVIGFVWNRYVIDDLRLQVFDLNQEVLQMRLKDEKPMFEIKESNN